MIYNFDELNNRIGTYCTQWDYVADRFNRNDVLPFSISDTDFIIPKPITKKIQEVSKHEIYGYSRWNHHDYKSSITGFFKRRFNTDFNEDWIVYSPSVMYSLSLLVRLLCKPHDKVLTLSPMYGDFYNLIRDNEREMVEHFLVNENGHYSIDFELLNKELASCQLMLLCSPHNPTGRIWTKEEVDKIIFLCKKHNVRILSDEIHMDIQAGQNKHIPLMSYYDEYQEIYTASSSSKTLNTPGLIGSYAIIPNEDIKQKFLYRTKSIDFLNSASIFGMHATMVGYTECDDYIDQLNEYIRKNMTYVDEFFKKELPDFKFTIPDGTYLAWIDARNVPYTMDEIQDALINIGKIGIMRGDVYGAKGYLRMNIGCPISKIEEGLHRFKMAMDYLYKK